MVFVHLDRHTISRIPPVQVYVCISNQDGMFQDCIGLRGCQSLLLASNLKLVLIATPDQKQPE